jgi:hypothetical protein
MIVELHPHARERLIERGATEEEVVATIHSGERFPARFGRTGFRRNFSFAATWRGRTYATKQLEVYAVEENRRWLVITLIVRFF